MVPEDIEGGGWIKVHRGLAGHHFWLRDSFTMGQAWVDLLLLANWKDSTATRGNRVIHVRRGQILTSLGRLSDRWKRNRKTISAWVSVFAADNALDIESVRGPDGGYTLLTVRNFERYQGGTTDEVDNALDHGLDKEDGQRNGSRSGLRSGPRSGQIIRSKEVEEGEEGAPPFESTRQSTEEWDHIKPGPVNLP